MKNLKFIFLFIFFFYISSASAYFLFDNFEDGDEFNNFKGVWYTMSDADEDTSQIYDFNGDGIKQGTLVVPGSEDAALPVYGGANGSSYCFSMYMDLVISEFKDVGLYQSPYGALGASLGEAPDGSNKIVDLSQYYGIGFYVKSDAVSNFQFQAEDAKGQIWLESYKYDCHINSPNVWQLIMVPFAQMTKADTMSNTTWKAEGASAFGFAGENTFNVDAVDGITFFVSDPNVKGNFLIDDVYFLTESEFAMGMLPIDSNHNGIYDAQDALRLLNVQYSDTMTDTFNLELFFNRSDVKGNLDISITDLSGGLLKQLSMKLDENSSVVSKIIQKNDDNGNVFKEGLYILKVKFSDNFGNKVVKKLGLALN